MKSMLFIHIFLNLGTHAIHNHNEIISHPSGGLLFKKKKKRKKWKITSIDKDMEKSEPWALLMRTEIGAAAM